MKHRGELPFLFSNISPVFGYNLVYNLEFWLGIFILFCFVGVFLI